ncbi:hypothetical protein [Gordonia polyisoprenivorans]|uniref:LGFP repeat-containing protein n=1 Tax=Gordonia polyisoprenivorans TaxID=84595 RepID=UPI00030E3765
MLRAAAITTAGLGAAVVSPAAASLAAPPTALLDLPRTNANGENVGGINSRLPYDLTALSSALSSYRRDSIEPTRYAAALQQYWVLRACSDAGIALPRWNPHTAITGNRATMEKCFSYYAALALENPRLQWAGMAAMVGPSFVAGLLDLDLAADALTIAQLRGALATVARAVHPHTTNPDIDSLAPAAARITTADVRAYEVSVVQMSKHVFFDFAPQLAAYTTSGIGAVIELHRAGLITADTLNAWYQINSGDAGHATTANAYLEYHEQVHVVGDQWDRARRTGTVIGQALTYLTTAPYEVCGVIRDKYNSLGGPNSFLKYPISNELTNPGNTGKRSEFMVGPIYWSAATGAHPVVNSFMTKWGSKGWEAGFLKYPTTDEIVLPDGVGRRQEFQGGSIYWHPVFAPGAASIGGAIRDHWKAAGAQSGKFGYPVSDEISPPAALAAEATLLNFFQGGAILWDSQRGATDALWHIAASPAGTPITPGPPIESPCPAEAIHKSTPYNCEAQFVNIHGEDVMLRYGRKDSDPAPQGGGGFGWMHALLDHGLDIDAIGKIVNQSEKVMIGSRYEYEAEFHAHGVTVVSVCSRRAGEDERARSPGYPSNGSCHGLLQNRIGSW